MKDPLHIRRRNYAWFLLLTLCFQRMIGFVGSEVVYAVEIKTGMDEAEEAIAQRIKSETGYEMHVTVHDENQAELLQKLGYVAPFLFLEEIGNRESFYTVEDPSAKTETYLCKIPKQNDNSQPFSTAKSFNDRLFSSFYFWEFNYTMYSFPSINLKVFSNPYALESICISVPSPPPKRVFSYVFGNQKNCPLFIV